MFKNVKEKSFFYLFKLFEFNIQAKNAFNAPSETPP